MLTLFDDLPDGPARVNRDRDEAIARVAANAEARRRQFVELAAGFVLAYLEMHGPTSGEVITNACKAAGIVPHDDRAFGPVYMGLVRAAKIHKVGTCRREKGHGSAGANVWALLRQDALPMES